LIEKLEDSQMTLGSMATNRYSAPFREEVQGWIVKLSTVSEIVEQWLMVQNMWMYMEAVFSGGDIVKQLPQVCGRAASRRWGQHEVQYDGCFCPAQPLWHSDCGMLHVLRSVDDAA
jgi:hypothetical protein